MHKIVDIFRILSRIFFFWRRVYFQGFSVWLMARKHWYSIQLWNRNRFLPLMHFFPVPKTIIISSGLPKTFVCYIYIRRVCRSLLIFLLVKLIIHRFGTHSRWLRFSRSDADLTTAKLFSFAAFALFIHGASLRRLRFTRVIFSCRRSGPPSNGQYSNQHTHIRNKIRMIRLQLLF